MPRKPRRKKQRKRISVKRPTRSGLKKVTQWRDKKTGVFTKAPRTVKQKRQRKKVEILYRVDVFGKHVTGIKYRGAETVHKRASTARLDEWGGSIGDTLDSLNATSTMMRYNALAVDVTLSGWIVRGGSSRYVQIKVSLDLEGIKERSMVRDVLLAKIMERLHDAGVRTQYKTELVTQWSKLKTRKWEAEQRQQLQHAIMTVTIRKG